MSLVHKLAEDMKAAMKEREKGKQRLSVIRMVRASLKNEEIKKKTELTEEETIEVIAREVKKRRESYEEYVKANRPDIAEGLLEEIAILMPYLPAQMSEEEIRSLVQEVVAEVQPTGPKDMGKVMSKLMPKVKGRADGKLVSQIVKEMLA